MLLDRAEPIYRQIALHFETEIFEGRLKSGDKLPSTRDLATEFKVNPETVQTSLKMLADRGLIERRRKCGSFVRPKRVAGKTIGIAIGREIFGSLDMAFFCLFFNKTTSLLEAEGWKIKLFVITREYRFDQGFYELERAISENALDAVLEICTNGLVEDWLEKHCAVPFFKPPILADYGEMIRLAASHLSSLGRRRPALIFDFEHINAAVIASATERSKKELSLPDDAFRAVHAEPAIEWGYRAAKSLFEEAGPAFDSIIVIYDNACRGVLYYLLEKGLKIPRDVALLTHANKGIELFSHIPLTRMEFDPDDFVKTLIASLAARIEGRPFDGQLIKPKLVKGLSCGEEAQ